MVKPHSVQRTRTRTNHAHDSKYTDDDNVKLLGDLKEGNMVVDVSSLSDLCCNSLSM